LDGQLYELNISRESLKIFLDKVGFINKKHNVLTEKLKILNYYSESNIDKIKKIEYVGQKEVYDLTEPETFTFISNGFISLDCGE
jgi:ribonucleoside-diphosphate reductase alpha chain